MYTTFIEEAGPTQAALLDDLTLLGERTAWEYFFQQYHQAIVKLVVKLARIRRASNPEWVADEVAQRIVMTIKKRLKTYKREEKPFRVWLAVVSKHEFINELKRVSGSITQFSGFELEVTEKDLLEPLDEVANEELKFVIYENVRKQVGEAKWFIFLLRSVEDLSAIKIAQESKLSLRKVYRILEDIYTRLEIETSKYLGG
jgi:RNA polymerase sigma factor (sigma-70 family)